jgi:hypothetical protein
VYPSKIIGPSKAFFLLEYKSLGEKVKLFIPNKLDFFFVTFFSAKYLHRYLHCNGSSKLGAIRAFLRGVEQKH